ncbi:MAG TPA: hypothetical protein VI756_10230 [Blastocatellia bacterium]
MRARDGFQVPFVAQQHDGPIHLVRLFRKVGRTLEYPPDPDDEPYLNIAIEARAD